MSRLSHFPIVLVTLFFLSCDDQGTPTSSVDTLGSGIAAAAAAAKPAKGHNIIVALKGTGTAQARTVPDIDGDSVDDPATCFDIDLVDLKTDNVIGSASDCLSDITPVGDGLALVGTTYFNFNEGTLISRGLTTVQPTTHGSPDVTHITGAIPSPGDNNIVGGTGPFVGATGTVRLSGAVNMSKLNSDGEITFDCVFVIDLD